MSTNNNFLKISVFNLEQQIKSQAEKYLQDAEACTEKLETLRKKIKDRAEYPNKETVIANLDLYDASLNIIKFEVTHLIDCIEALYTHEKPKPKRNKVTKTTKKPKKP